MRNNYHNPSQSEDSVTKISRSKSRNQMSISSKIKEKVTEVVFRRADGIKDFILNIYLSITTSTNPIHNVNTLSLRPQKQT